MIESDDKKTLQSSAIATERDVFCARTEKNEKTPDAQAPAAFNSIEDAPADADAVENKTVGGEQTDGNDTADEKDVEHTGDTAVDAEKGEEEKRQKRDHAFAAELAALSVKAIAVALSLVVLILSILSVAMPLQAMRVFNTLGLSERAMNSGDRYIRSRLDNYDADEVDDMGNYVKLAQTPALSDDDFVEALDVCIDLSGELADENFSDGDGKNAEYFARKLEMYTRMFSSLNGVRGICAAKDAASVSAMPSPVMHPAVYSYLHTLFVANFRARAIDGDLDKVLYNTNRDGESVTLLAERSRSLSGISSALTEYTINAFVDYSAQLGEYISVELERLGIPEGIDESSVQEKFINVLDGSEFALFITPTSGYTDYWTFLYNGNSTFTDYAQAAVDYSQPTYGMQDELDLLLKKLFWLQELNSASYRIWDMTILLYYSNTHYGVGSSQIVSEYTQNKNYDKFRHVMFDMGDGYGVRSVLISDVYRVLMERYVRMYAEYTAER